MNLFSSSLFTLPGHQVRSQVTTSVMGQTQSTGTPEERSSTDNRASGKADYYKILGLERDASEDE